MSRRTKREAAVAVQALTLPTTFPGWVLPLLIGIYVVLTAALILSVPMGGAPDEGAHLEYVDYVASHGSFPVFKGVQAPQPGYEFHQPPLYYMLCAPLWKFSSGATQGYLCRFISLICGALTLLLMWQAVRSLFPTSRSLPVVATGFAALWPLHQQVGAMAGNDALTGLLCAALLWAIARGVQHPWTLRDSALVGLLFGLGLLSKSTSITVGVAALLAAWLLPSRQRSEDAPGVSPLYSAAAALGVTLLVAGWWLARNQTLYGDPLATRVFSETFRSSSPGPAAFLAAGLPLDTYVRAALTILFCSFWGIFGTTNHALDIVRPFSPRGPLPEALQLVPFMLLCLAATVLALWGLVRWGKTIKDLTVRQRVVLGCWGLATILVFLALARFNLMFFQVQARYLHPALLPLALGFALGWLQLCSNECNEQRSEAKSARSGLLFMGAFGLLLIVLTLWNVLKWRVLS